LIPELTNLSLCNQFFLFFLLLAVNTYTHILFLWSWTSLESNLIVIYLILLFNIIIYYIICDPLPERLHLLLLVCIFGLCCLICHLALPKYQTINQNKTTLCIYITISQFCVLLCIYLCVCAKSEEGKGKWWGVKSNMERSFHLSSQTLWCWRLIVCKTNSKVLSYLSYIIPLCFYFYHHEFELVFIRSCLSHWYAFVFIDWLSLWWI
jgi:hypothetical protein